ncbi:hypothetical protein [Nonomuraea sp. NPDC049725]|uniref:hypothetical protein n=1 Tax=Nonomuraea sp. NPDC049725 TaxID=3154508 RepID=UPI0034406BA1
MISAVAAVGAASVILPYARPIGMLMSLLISDPAEQDRGGDQWLDKTPVNVGPAVVGPVAAGSKQAPDGRSAHANGVTDLAYVRAELKRLGKEIGENEGWEGRAYTSFTEKINVLDGHLAKLDQNRVSAGNALKCSAACYHVLTLVCDAIGLILLALAGYVAIMRPTPPPANATAEATAISIVARLHFMLQGIMTKHRKLIYKATLIFGALAVGYNQFSQDLPGLQALPSEKPNLMEASVLWDASKSDLIDNPQAELDPGKIDSPMPDFGF